jgi:DNA repair protein RecN (Recombination protein N)
VLETLQIENYALIDQAEVDFSNGFNALTGETGAGKSIIVGALNLVLGARASTDAVRAEAKRAKIDALFRISAPSPRLTSLLEDHDLELEGDELLVSRTVTAEGRSRAYVAGTLVPLSVLSAIGDELVDLHGQHEHQSLLKPDRQLDALDSYANTTHDAASIAERVAHLLALAQEIASLESDDREQARQMEFLRFEVNEIDAAHLVAGEEEELTAQLSRITNAEALYEHANSAYQLLVEREDTAASDILGKAQAHLNVLAELDENFDALAKQLTELSTSLDSVSAELQQHTERVDYAPDELDTLNQRKVLLSDLKRKYGENIEEILEYRKKATAKLENFEHRDERLEQLQQQHAEQSREAQAKAEKLSAARIKAARKLDKQITDTLQELGMAGAIFQTNIERCELSTRGIDQITFQLAANTGEPLKPMSKVASGGEISRIMLALKSVFAEADTIPTLIFDEIDAGVGGAVARKVADKIAALAQSHQVLCITHIAQIAAVANTHYNVSKKTDNGRTLTQVTPIDDTARVEEIARLLDGSVSPVSLGHAKELLSQHLSA